MTTPLVISDLRGGRNGIDNPTDPQFPFNQCVEALNVDFFNSPLGSKRGGSVLTFTGITGSVLSMIRHVPAGNDGDAEFWFINTVPELKRWTKAGAITTPAITDAITAGTFARGVSFNGKLFLFYDTGVDRPHVWDGTVIRRMGIAAPSAAPTVANTGAGAYPAVLRYYRTRVSEWAAGVLVRRSEPSASVSFTPSGAGTHARITQPAPTAAETATHWEIEVSLDNAVWYQLASAYGANAIAIATTTHDTNLATTSVTSGVLADMAGTYSTPTSAKFAIVVDNRIVMAGANETGGKTSRVWWTDPLGIGKGDDERVPARATIANYLDINEKDSGEITAIVGPIDGSFWVFKYRQVWRFTPTSDPNTPYTARKISNVIGAVNQESAFLGEDAVGNPAVYFWSARGPYRLGINGIEYIGRDIEDIILGGATYPDFSPTAVWNLAATTIAVHGTYYGDKSQVWYWIATGGSNTPNVRVRLDVKQSVHRDRFGVRGGWMADTGNAAAATSSVMFGITSDPVGKKLYPYAGRAGDIYRCDTEVTSDNNTAYQSYVITRSVAEIKRLGQRFGIKDGLMLGVAPSEDVTLQVKLRSDFSARAQNSNVSLTPVAPETSWGGVVRHIDGAQDSDMGILQVQYGDGAAQVGSWSVSAIQLNVDDQGDLS